MRAARFLDARGRDAVGRRREQSSRLPRWVVSAFERRRSAARSEAEEPTEKKEPPTPRALFVVPMSGFPIEALALVLTAVDVRIRGIDVTDVPPLTAVHLRCIPVFGGQDVIPSPSV